MDAARKLGQSLEKRYGPFPSRYFVFDIETTGLQIGTDLVTEIGYCLVEGGQVVLEQSTVLDWTRCALVEQDWLQLRLQQVAECMQAKGSTTLSYEELQQRGQDPLETLQAYCRLFQEWAQEGRGVVFHNGIRFDWPFLDALLDKYLQDRLRLQTRCWDTQAIERALLLVQSGRENCTPYPSEPEDEYLLRMASTWSRGHKTSLSEHCVPRYGLEDRLAGRVFHTATDDAYATHLVLQAQQRVLGLAERTQAHECVGRDRD